MKAGLGRRRAEVSELIARLDKIADDYDQPEEPPQEEEIAGGSLPPGQKKKRKRASKGKLDLRAFTDILKVLANNLPNIPQDDPLTTYGKSYTSKAGAAHLHALICFERRPDSPAEPGMLLLDRLKGFLSVGDKNIQYFSGRAVEEGRRTKQRGRRSDKEITGKS